jgi:hypothetical protein
VRLANGGSDWRTAVQRAAVWTDRKPRGHHTSFEYRIDELLVGVFNRRSFIMSGTFIKISSCFWFRISKCYNFMCCKFSEVFLVHWQTCQHEFQITVDNKGT